MSKGRKRRIVTYEEAVDELPAAENAVVTASLAYSQAYDDALAALARCNGVINAEGKRLMAARSHRDTLKAVVEKGQGARAPVMATVENPHITDGLREEDENAAAFIQAPMNMVELIGGLARVQGVNKAQINAAAKYRALHERAQLGGGRATDYSAVKVDTSGPTEEMVEAIGAQARAEYMEAVQALGMQQSSLIERVIVHDVSLREIAVSLGLGDSGGARKKARAMLFEALNKLVDHFKLMPHAKRPRHWDDGTEQHYHGEIINPKRPLAA